MTELSKKAQVPQCDKTAVSMTEKYNANDKSGFGYPLLGDVRRHGEGFCEKILHNGYGYLHSKEDDTAYFVDGIGYCGRCHCCLDKFSD